MENYMSGTAIVMDVLRLLINLVVANEPNQQLFMKSGYADTLVSEIKSSLDLITSSFPPKLASAETAYIIGLALEVVMACYSDRLTEKIIPMVRKLVSSGPLNSQLTVALWRILTHSLLMNLDIGLENQKDAQYMITLAFQGSFSYSSAVERHAAGNFVAVALEKIGSVSYDPLEIIVKSISELKLLEKLHSFDLESLLASSRFAASMAIFLLDNQDLRFKLLEVSPSTTSSQNLVQLFTGQLACSILQYGTTDEAEEMAANFCAILLAWLPKSADAVARFLDQLRNAPFLVGSLLSADKFGSSAIVIQGVCSVLLGICCLYAPPDAAVNPSLLIEAISNQVGWERYLDQLHNFMVKSEGGPVDNVPLWPEMSCAKLRSVLEITHKEMRQLSPFAVVSSSALL
jgi:hypothetical protein